MMHNKNQHSRDVKKLKHEFLQSKEFIEEYFRNVISSERNYMKILQLGKI